MTASIIPPDEPLSHEIERLESIIQYLERTTPLPQAAVTTPEESRKLSDILLAWIMKNPESPDAAILAEDARKIVKDIHARYILAESRTETLH